MDILEKMNNLPKEYKGIQVEDLSMYLEDAIKAEKVCIYTNDIANIEKRFENFDSVVLEIIRHELDEDLTLDDVVILISYSEKMLLEMFEGFNYTENSLCLEHIHSRYLLTFP
jgi:hypothetical protein